MRFSPHQIMYHIEAFKKAMTCHNTEHMFDPTDRELLFLLLERAKFKHQLAIDEALKGIK